MPSSVSLHQEGIWIHQTPPLKQKTNALGINSPSIKKQLHLSVAKNEYEIREAQRLRYQIFGEELGAQLNDRIPGHDIDRFDAHCAHILVRNQRGEVVGTYRLISPETVKKVGGYYAESEFSIQSLSALKPHMIEIGRFCIHPDYRNGAVMALLWVGLGQYIAKSDYRYLIGSASIGLSDGGHNAANIYQHFLKEKIVSATHWVTPFHPLPHAELVNGQKAVIPPLIKGYLRAGGQVCGAPAWDVDFNTADLLFLLPISRLTQRYEKTFLDPYRANEKNHEQQKVLALA